MEQFVSDNERLRKKVSELGERMEFYKEKLLKYRNLYFQVVGQDPNTKPSVSSNDVSREHQPAVKLGSQLSIQERPPSGMLFDTLTKYFIYDSLRKKLISFKYVCSIYSIYSLAICF